jgi:hypothetical protein
MGVLGGRLGIQKVKDGEEGERFQIRFEDPANADRAGYIFSTSSLLSEEELRDALTRVSATPADLTRILAEARANYAST